MPTRHRLGEIIVGERLGDSKVTQNDMLGSLIAHGLSQGEARLESLLRFSSFDLAIAF